MRWERKEPLKASWQWGGSVRISVEMKCKTDMAHYEKGTSASYSRSKGEKVEGDVCGREGSAVGLHDTTA